MKIDIMDLFLFPLVCILLFVNQGYALSLTWNLFVPQFFGLPQLPMLIAIAVVFLISVTRVSNYKKPEKYTETKDLVFATFLPFVAPWFGYLCALLAVNLYF